ncbi:MAG: hypothetical protein ACRDZQ_10575 [Acidimicrobiales bacterium]
MVAAVGQGVVVGLGVAALVLLAAAVAALVVLARGVAGLRASVDRVGGAALPVLSGSRQPPPAAVDLAAFEPRVDGPRPGGPGSRLGAAQGPARPGGRLVRLVLSDPVIKAVAAGSGAAGAARSFRQRRGA